MEQHYFNTLAWGLTELWVVVSEYHAWSFSPLFDISEFPSSTFWDQIGDILYI